MAHRLYLFTGKGGVGKTLSSLACAHLLQGSGHHVLWVDLDSLSPQLPSPDHQSHQHRLCQSLAIPHHRPELFACFEHYIQSKLRSRRLAKLISHNKFFQSLIRVVPGISYLAYLSQLVSMLEADPALTIIVDSPSSGHALMMMESGQNYRQIFRSGLLFNDIQRTFAFLHAPQNLRILIGHIPSQLALSEGGELQAALKRLQFSDLQLFLNCSLALSIDGIEEELPPYLKQRIQLEYQLNEQYHYPWAARFPYLSNSNDGEKIKALAPYCKDLIS